MTGYILRRILYAMPILLGVNVLIFILFFFVNSPDNMAEAILGQRHTSPEQIENWKREHGYHLPKLFNADEPFPASLTQTIFWQKSMRLFLFDFGRSDRENADIGREMARRIPFSLLVTFPAFVAGLLLNLVFAMLAAFYRGTYIDVGALVVCVVLMSVSMLFYIIGGQYLFAIQWKLFPVSGFDPDFPHSVKFLALPILIGILGGIGGGVRYYRTIFLEEIGKDYVRTARAKGLGEGAVLFRHALKNAMLPIITNVVVMIPFLIMGSLLLENFFGIPGLGSYTIEAIGKQDFAVIRAMVFVGSLLYVGGLVAVDICYTLVDPRIRLS